MHRDATWYGGKPQPRGLCLRLGKKDRKTVVVQLFGTETTHTHF